MFNIVVAIVYYNLLKKLIAENVALGKHVTYCGVRSTTTVVTDGEVTPFEQFPICNSLTPGYLDIELQQDYYVHYVVVHQGPTAASADQLDYFVVKLSINGSFIKCSEYPARSNRTAGMRVNCKPLGATRDVRIESRKNEGMLISEVEVHTLGINNNDILAYRGCFSEFLGEQRRNIGVYECQKICQASNTYMAMKGGRTCFCGNSVTIGSETSLRHCNIPCNVQWNCGGDNAFSVFIVNVQLPYYLGCYDIGSLVMPFEGEHTNSIINCMNFCQDKLYILLTGGNTCHCSSTDLIREHNTAYDICNMQCHGDSNTFCGGVLGYSVYKTCFDNIGNSLKCSELFHCSGPWNEYGVCTTGCNMGFVGLHCFERVFPVEDGCWLPNICRNLINTICRPTNNSYTCDCKIGYFLENGICQGRMCTNYNPCLNQSLTICKNRNGDVWCDCIDGFSKSSMGICEDVNECEYTPCDIRFSNCVNLNGSFMCICRFGFFSLSTELCIENVSMPEEEDYHEEDTAITGNLKILTVVIISLVVIVSIYRNLRLTSIMSGSMIRRASSTVSTQQSAISF